MVVPVACAVFDIGETLIDESRIFQRWADRLGVPRLAFLGTVGAVVNAGRPLEAAFQLLRPGIDLQAEQARWRQEQPEALRTGFDAADLYPDSRDSLAALRARGLRVLIAGNQPLEARPALEAMQLPADAVYVSEEWGVAKPDPGFFARVQQAAGCDPSAIVYVGDRLDNDVLPAKAAGMRAVLLRRGPHGYLHSERAESGRADAVLDTLAQLPSWIDSQGTYP